MSKAFRSVRTGFAEAERKRKRQWDRKQAKSAATKAPRKSANTAEQNDR